jgi:hypothetical protein
MGGDFNHLATDGKANWRTLLIKIKAASQLVR